MTKHSVYRLSSLLVLLAMVLACGSASVTQTGAGESARVARVVDGDTVELTDGRKVRYLGINTPEGGQPFYQEATDFNAWLVEGREVWLEYDVNPMDRYGRLLAYVWVGETFINLELVRQGYATVYTVPPNVRYDEQFLEAQREAREQERGLWATSRAGVRITALNYDAPGQDRLNLNGEWVEITNEGSEPVDLTGYMLQDDTNHIYTFGEFVMPPGATVRIYTGQGTDTDTELYWGYVGEAVWNNDGDTAYLRDPDGSLVDSYSY